MITAAELQLAEKLAEAAKEIARLGGDISTYADVLQAARERKTEQESAQYVLTLIGDVPAKKNLKKPVIHYRKDERGRKIPFLGMANNAEVEAQLNNLVLQARFQWRHREPLIHPEISIRFAYPSFGKDQDNAFTTILDVLQDARVIKNDNAKWNNGWKHIAPVVHGEPKTWIVLTANGQLMI